MVQDLVDSGETARLLADASSGRPEAFDELFDRHRATLYRAVRLRLDRRLQARVDPSDIVQEVHMQAYRRLDDYLAKRPMPFGLWLRRTAQDQLANHQRTHLHAAKRSVTREQQFPEESSLLIVQALAASTSNPSRRLSKFEYANLVNVAVNQLDELDREILLLRNVEGLTQREIARLLDLSHDAVRKRYGRALLKLQQELARRGVSELES